MTQTHRLALWGALLVLLGSASHADAAAVALPRLTPLPAAVDGVRQPEMSLDGAWQFNPAPSQEFWKTGIGGQSGWSPIQVPGEWVMQGFTVAKDAAAGYFREFGAPHDWNGLRVKLRCDAVYSDATVWINGQEAGRHEGGFTPFELDVTPLIRSGTTNTIALAVKNESLSDILASGTQYAAHQLGGITRKIRLFAAPEVHVASIRVDTVFDAAYRDATLRVRLQIANEGPREAAHLRATLTLASWSQSLPSVALGSAELPAAGAGEIRERVLEFGVVAPKPWDAEHPYLYTVHFRLEQQERALETVSQRFGFRQVEVRGNEMFVNNHPIKLRGSDRHEVHPLLGRSLTRELWRKDAELFRNANVNYIRTSHYPPAEEFIDACDEYGLFVEEEAPLCWIGHGANATWQQQSCQDPQYAPNIIRPILEMVQRDYNHPSVIIWSLANESLWGASFQRAREAIDAADPTRPKSFHDQGWGAYNNQGSNLPVANYHYPDLNGPDRAGAETRPMLFGEYCHLNTYNRQEIVTDPGVRDYWGRGLALMWERMVRAKGCLGGAIWAGIDDVFALPSGETIGYGMWGIIDGWRRPKPEYWHVKQIYSPVQITTKVVAVPEPGAPIIVEVANRYDFTNLKELRIEWSIDGEFGTVEADIAPRNTGRISIPASSANLQGKTLRLEFINVRAGAGYTVSSFRLPIGAPSESKESAAPVTTGQLSFERSDNAFMVKGNGFLYAVDRNTGQIVRAERDGKTVLVGGPVLMILPLKGGSCATDHRADIPAFNETCHDWKAAKCEAEETPEGVVVRVEGGYLEASGFYSIRIDGAGRLAVEYSFTNRSKIDPRQIGLVFALPKSCDTLRWKRNAVWTVYPDDHIGRPEGTAKAFPLQTARDATPRTEPAWPWSQDCTALGSNDSRSSKNNFRHASLTAETGEGVRVTSDGSQTVRAFVDGDQIKLLVADYSNGGAEPFFSSQLAGERRPLEPGAAIQGVVHLELVSAS